MKTRFFYIHFEQTPGGQWACYANQGDYELGYCEPYPKWHQWQFVSAPECAFTTACLNDIARFMSQLPKP